MSRKRDDEHEREAEAPPALKLTAPAPTKGATVRGRVWKHGAVHFDGAVYPAGSVATLPRDVAEKLGEVFIAE